jgi:hypothetical protein
MLLAPRDYLSTSMKIGTIVLLALGIILTLPVLENERFTGFASSGEVPAFAGSLFPFMFIIIADVEVRGERQRLARPAWPERDPGPGGRAPEPIAVTGVQPHDRHVATPFQAVRERVPRHLDGRHDRRRAREQRLDRRPESLRGDLHLPQLVNQHGSPRSGRASAGSASRLNTSRSTP